MSKSIVSGRWSVPENKDGHALFRNITGERFGRLVALRPTEKRLSGHIAWLCRCDCGMEKLVSGKKLRTGNTVTCGCGRLDGHRSRKHGESIPNNRGGTREYRAWKSMLSRCCQPARKDYKYYGGRGIIVCERWFVYENFLADMVRCPENLTLERIDNDAGYFPANCKWASRLEQMRNTRRSKHR